MTEKSGTVNAPKKDVIVTAETVVTPHTEGTITHAEKDEEKKEECELIATEDEHESTETPLNPVRKAALQIVEAKRFDTLIIGLIAVNCVFLAMEDPTKADHEKGHFQAEVLPAVEITFAVIFTIELILRCVAHGVPSYLDSGWNRMDALIVVISWVSIAGDFLGNLSSLRALRVLRALRMVTQFEGLKLLVETLFQAAPHLATAAALYVSVFLVYGCIGLHVWSGTFHNRCFHQALGTMEEYSDTDTICSNDMGAFRHCPINYNCAPYEKNPFYNTASFDNLGAAALIVFQLCALEGWTTFLYMTMDASGAIAAAVAVVFYISAVIIGGFLAGNLFLAILKNEYSKVSKAHEDARGESMEKTEPDEATPKICCCFSCPESSSDTVEQLGVAVLTEEQPPSCGKRINLAFLAVADHPFFDRIFMGAILLNTIALMVEYQGMSDDYAATLEWLNFVLTISFLLELVIKMIAYGCRGYFSDRFNCFDFFIVSMSMVELLGSGGGGLSALRVLRSGKLVKVARLLRVLRSLRVVRIAKFIEPLRKIMVVVQQTVPTVGWVSAMLTLCVFFFAILGMQFFGGKMDFGTRPTPDSNFDTFWHSVLTVFQVVTLDDWPSVMQDTVHATKEFAVLYFVALIVVGYFVVTNLVLAVMLTSFETPVENLENKEQGIIVVKDRTENDDEEEGTGLKMEWEIARERSERAVGAVEKYLMNQLAHAEKQAEAVGHSKSDAEFAKEAQIQWNHYCVVGNFPDFLQPLHHATLHKEPVPKEFLIYEAPQEETLVEEAHVVGDVVSPVSGDSETTIQENRLFEVRTTEGASLRVEPGTGKSTNVSEDEETEEGDGELPEEGDEEEDEELGPQGTTCCGQWGADHPIRMRLFTLTHTAWFMNTVLIAIVLSCIQLAWETYADSDIEDTILAVLDYLLTVLFTFEMGFKMVSNGVWDNDQAYFKSNANCLDFFIVCISWLSIALSSIDLSFLRSMRALRCIRPLRVLSRSKSMMCVIQSLARSMAGIANVAALAVAVLLVYGILGLQLFTGQSDDMCSDNSIHNIADCTGTFLKDDRFIDREWLSTEANFDNIGASMLTLTEIATLEGWAGYMHFYVKATGTEATSVFFVAWVVIASYFILNLFIGVVFQEFMKASEGPSGFSMLTPQQQEWVMCSRTLFQVPIPPPMTVPTNIVQAALQKMVHSKLFERIIGGMIVANVMVLTFHFWPEPMYWQDTLNYFGVFFSGVFFLEAVAKIWGDGFKTYIVDGWNRFDLILVVTSIIEMSLDLSGVGEESGGLISVIRVLRIFRVFRMLRLIRNLAPLRKMASVLLVSLPAILNVGAVLMLIYFMFGVLGVSFFADVPQTGDGITRHANFENLGFAMLTLFRISTGEDWHLIMHDCMRVNTIASLYFVTFVIVISFVMINVFVACVVDNMKASQGDSFPSGLYQQEWSRLDPTGSGYIDADKLKDLLTNIDAPYGVSSDVNPTDLLIMLSALNIPSHNGKHHFSEVLYCIIRRAVGVALPPGQLVDTMMQEMKKQFPVSNLDPDMIVTAAQRRVTYKVIEKLKQRVLLNKLSSQQEKGGDFDGTWQEEAAAKMIYFVFFMIRHQDCIASQDLAEERKILLDPTIDDQVYIDLMLSRRQERQEELLREQHMKEVAAKKEAFGNSEEMQAIREQQRQLAETAKKLRDAKDASRDSTQARSPRSSTTQARSPRSVIEGRS